MKRRDFLKLVALSPIGFFLFPKETKKERLLREMTELYYNCDRVTVTESKLQTMWLSPSKPLVWVPCDA